MAPYSFTIFTKKTMIKNVLPFFLDGGIQSVNEAGPWSGKSSFVEADDTTASMTITVGHTDSNGKPVKHGTIAAFSKTAGSNTTTIDPSSDFTASQTSVALDSIGDSVLYLYKGPSGANKLGEWVVLSKFQVDTTNSLSAYATQTYVSDQLVALANADTIYNGDLTFSGLEKVQITAAVTATGTTQADAATLTVDSRVLEVSGTGSDGVVFPQVPNGTVVTLINSGAGGVNVYPASTNTINGGAQAAAYVLAAGSAATLVFNSTNAYLV